MGECTRSEWVEASWFAQREGEVVSTSPISEIAAPSPMLKLQSNDGSEGARDQCELSCENCDNKVKIRSRLTAWMRSSD